MVASQTFRVPVIIGKLIGLLFLSLPLQACEVSTDQSAEFRDRPLAVFLHGAPVEFQHGRGKSKDLSSFDEKTRSLLAAAKPQGGGCIVRVIIARSKVFGPDSGPQQKIQVVSTRPAGSQLVDSVQKDWARLGLKPGDVC
jgi:hypothetical protein